MMHLGMRSNDIIAGIIDIALIPDNGIERDNARLDNQSSWNYFPPFR